MHGRDASADMRRRAKIQCTDLPHLGVLVFFLAGDAR